MYTGLQSAYKTLSGYLSRYYYYDVSSEATIGKTVFSMNYTKQFKNTALQFTSSGAHSVIGHGECITW